MNVSLTPELEKMVNKRVKSGMYNSASEVVVRRCGCLTSKIACEL
jgi:putative addiction module CopG family antidote